MARITYSAVVLDKKSQSKLKEMVSSYVPNGWEVIAHHMTINMGELKPDMKRYLGNKVKLRVKTLGMSDLVMAVGVEGFPSNNGVPHITVAVDRKGGGKPYLSNKINDWRPIQFALDLDGVVTEVPW